MPIETLVDQTYGVIPVRKKGGEWEFLVIKSRRGHWGFPKGHANPGETPVLAATRELREETGITRAAVYEDIFFTESHAVSGDVRVVTKLVTWFLGVAAGDQIVNPLDTEEIVENRWLDFKGAFPLITYESTKQILLDVKEYLSNHAI